MKNYALLFTILLFATSCNSKKKVVETPKENIHRIWMLIEFGNFTREQFTVSMPYLDLKDPNNASSKMGCNNLSFPYQIIGNSEIEFSPGIATRMYCEDMRLEREFSKAITQKFSYNISKHQLTLVSKNGEKIVFAAQDWD